MVVVGWSYVGSSMVFLIAFVLPFGCFVEIEGIVTTKRERGDREEEWIGLSRVILAFPVVGTVVCVANNAMGLWGQRGV